MRHRARFLLATLATLVGAVCAGLVASIAARPPASAVPDLALWYDEPAASWNEALPIGNGRLGAMVFGGTAVERLQLNEDTVWAGERRDRINPAAAAAIPQIRRLLAAGKAVEAETLADQAVISVPRRLPPYQTLGDLRLSFPDPGVVAEYRRSLDLDAGVAITRYRAGRTMFTREAFASAVAGVIVVRVTRHGPDPVTITARLDRERDASTTTDAGGRLVLSGQAIAHGSKHADERPTGVRFTAMVQAVSEGGTIRTEGGALVVEGAGAVTLLIAAATDVRERDPAAACLRLLDAAARRTFTALRADHVADHQRLFHRVALRLGGPSPTLPTDARLAAMARGEADEALAALLFQYGRYLLIASSRPGSMPANLQGLWNESLAPPWDSKYTININTEMNYWPAEVTNLAELHEPLFDLIDRARPDGRRVAREMYGAAAPQHGSVGPRRAGQAIAAVTRDGRPIEAERLSAGLVRLHVVADSEYRMAFE